MNASNDAAVSSEGKDGMRYGGQSSEDDDEEGQSSDEYDDEEGQSSDKDDEEEVQKLIFEDDLDNVRTRKKIDLNKDGGAILSHFDAIYEAIELLLEFGWISAQFALLSFTFLNYAFELIGDSRLAFMADVVLARLCLNIAVCVVSILVLQALGNKTNKSLKELHDKLMELSPSYVAADRTTSSKKYPRVWRIGKKFEDYELKKSVHTHFDNIKEKLAAFLGVATTELDYESMVRDPLHNLALRVGSTTVTMKAFECLHWAILGRVRVVYLARIIEEGYTLSDAGWEHFCIDVFEDFARGSLSMFNRWFQRRRQQQN